MTRTSPSWCGARPSAPRARPGASRPFRPSTTTGPRRWPERRAPGGAPGAWRKRSLLQREHADLGGVGVGDQHAVDRLLLGLAGAARLDELVRLLDRHLGDLGGGLEDRGVHRAGLDLLHGVGAAVEADDLDLLAQAVRLEGGHGAE